MPRVADPRRREVILEAARQTFMREGFAESRMTAIAQRAKMGVGTLYLYFESKDDIARALAGVTFAKAAATIIPILLEKPLTRARIALLVRRAFESVFEDSSVGRTGIPLHDVAPALAPDSYAMIVSQFAWALDRQMEEGHVRRMEPMTLADYVIILIRRAVLQSANNGRTREPYESTVTELLSAALLTTNR